MRINDAGPPGARFTSKNVIALTRTSTIIPCTTRCAAIRNIQPRRHRTVFSSPKGFPLGSSVTVILPPRGPLWGSSSLTVISPEESPSAIVSDSHLSPRGSPLGSFLLLKPPLRDVVHVVAQVDIRHALEVGVDHVGLGLDLRQQIVQLGVLVPRDVESLPGGAGVEVRKHIGIVRIDPPIHRRGVVARYDHLLDVRVPLH